MEGGTPAMENRIIIIPSTAPTPPGNSGTMAINADITNTEAITNKET